MTILKLNARDKKLWKTNYLNLEISLIERVSLLKLDETLL